MYRVSLVFAYLAANWMSRVQSDEGDSHTRNEGLGVVDAFAKLDIFSFGKA